MLPPGRRGPRRECPPRPKLGCRALTPKFDLLGRSKRFRWVNVTLLALMALAMIGLIVVAFQTIESERAEREQVERTNDILLELRNVSSAAVNAETGGKLALVEIHREEIPSLPQLLTKLRENERRAILFAPDIQCAARS